MLVSIRPKSDAAPAVEHPVDALLACHERIRGFVSLAERLVVVGAEATGPAIADAATRVATYFDQAFPLHAEDEDRSVAPRLLARGAPEEIRLELARMTAEHPDLERDAAALVVAARAVASAPVAEPPREQLGRVLARFAPAALAHLEIEETVLFPAGRRLLRAEDVAAIASELRARRGG